MEFDEFLNDEKTSSAVIKKLEIIGEASKNVPESIRNRYDELPWKDMARMRDKTAHSYFGINYEIIWKVVKEDAWGQTLKYKLWRALHVSSVVVTGHSL